MSTSPGRPAPRLVRRLVACLVATGLLAVSTTLVSSGAQAQTVEGKRAEAAAVADELAALDNRLMDLNAQAEAARYELSQAEEKVAEIQQRVAETGAQLEATRSELQVFAVDAYMGGGETPEQTDMLTTDVNSAPAKSMYIVATTGDRNDLLDAFAATKQQAEADAADLEAAQAEARQQSDGIEAKRAGVLEATEAQRALNERVQGDLADLVRQEQERREAAQRAEAERQSEASSARERAAAEDSTPTSSPAPVDAASNRPAPGSGGGLGVLIAPATPAAPAPSPGAPNGGADGAIAAALGQVGRSSYVWGAASPPNFDCSGLTSWAYRQAGVSLPHYSGSQWNVTRRISRSQLQRGDLVFWGSGGSEHVAIYMGGNQIVHAYGSGRGVQTTALDGWWKPATGYGRIG